MPGTLGAIVGARLDGVSAREHLLSAQALSSDGVNHARGMRIVEIRLLIV
jgi:hypothetical protein